MIGKCHICKRTDRELEYCVLCAHWFCADCQGRWWSRTREFLLELIGDRTEGCCGPVEMSE